MSQDAGGRCCQSCAMPMDGDLRGDNADGSPNDDYCMHCYRMGGFTANLTMEEMIEICVPLMVRDGMSEREARRTMEELLPTMKRWG